MNPKHIIPLKQLPGSLKTDYVGKTPLENIAATFETLLLILLEQKLV